MPRTASGRAWRALLCALVACAASVVDPRASVPVAAQPRSQPSALNQRQFPIGFATGAPGVAAADFAAGVGRGTAPNSRSRTVAPPDDPYRGNLWGLDRIAAPAAWETTTGGAIVVGVVGTGIDHDHPDLAANMWTAAGDQNIGGCQVAGSHGYRSIGGVTGCAPADTDDDHGHGTHVAGTIGAVGNNGVGVTGVNWTVKLMSLKALDASGNGTPEDLVAVINYAVAAKQAQVNLRVLLLDWFSTTLSDPQREALRLALEAANTAGILVVAPAGDGSADNDLAPVFPASYGFAPYNLPNVIAVTATTAGDIKASYANSGSNSVHLAAPGGVANAPLSETILSTERGGDYGVRNGTAMAAAHVAGAAALLFSAPGPGDLSVREAWLRLLFCGDLLSASTGTITNRRLNVAAAIAGCAMPSYAVTIAASPPEGGTVSPAGATYVAGSTLSLQAAAQPGYRFAGWLVDGQARGASNPLDLTVLRAHVIAASFVLEGFALSLTATPGGRASATPSPGPYPAGTVVQLTATAEYGFVFSGWTIDASPDGATNPRTLVMDRDRTVRANFAPSPSPGTTFILDLAAIGGGTVAASSPGPYVAGTTVQLTATPGQGQRFVGWTIDGAPGGMANPLALKMDADRIVRAIFLPGYSLQLSWTQGGSARAEATTWTGGSPYPAGTIVTLTATPGSDAIFTGWTIDGAFAGWANPLTMTMAGPHAVVANFTRRRHFTDLPPGPPPYEAISQLAARQIIFGYRDGSFGPNDTTQRAQMAALIARAMGWDAESHGNPFTDDLGIDPNLWRNVGTLAYYGVAHGYGDGRFGTLDPVLKAQVISFIARGMVARGRWVAATEDDPGLYPNVPASAGHRRDLVTYYRNAGAVPGTVATDPWPDWAAPATRGWFAEALWLALDRYFGVDRVP